MRRRVYIASPITRGDRLTNAKQADDAMFALMRAGLAPLSPVLSVWAGSAREGPAGEVAAVYQATPNGTTHADWMGMDLPWVAVADAVLRLPGNSVGADAEVAHAKSLGIPVFDSVAAVVEWAAV